jgi:general secretion pathway protein E
MEESFSASYFGRHLLANGLISAEDLKKAESYQERIGGRLGSILMRIGAVSEDSLLQAYSDTLGMRILTAKELPSDPMVYHRAIDLSGVDLDWWLDQEVLAWEDENGAICSFARDPFSDSLIETLERFFPDREWEIVLVHGYDLERLLDAVARAKTHKQYHSDSDIEMLRELAEEAPVIEFVNNLMTQAFEQRASDVHVEPGEHMLEARFRVDGVLYTRFTLPKDRYPAISSRIKLISGIDISERRLPQDGRIGMRLGGEEVDIRVSTAPGVHGESIVMRLLPKERKSFKLTTLGLEDDHSQLFNQWIVEPHGIILVTGPTGSGKSTTLYAALEAINTRRTKIITVEDPVEFQLDGITQIQTHTEIGYTFARALRSILRQDPDVIMIGEIRDKETAEIAIQAALTGHLVFSTLHTNDAVSAFTRLIDMGIEPFLVATPVRAVMAQRLVRVLCQACAEPSEPVADIRSMTDGLIRHDIRHLGPNWKKAKGCPACQGAGYKGRVGVYELVSVTSEMQHLILTGGSMGDMVTLARRHGRMLREDGLLKAWKGITSVDEVLRVTSS